MSSIIFLDIDGVLNSLRSFTAFEKHEKEVAAGTRYVAQLAAASVDPVSIRLINMLVEAAGAKIVVSSSHRLMFYKRYGYGEVPVLDLKGLREYIHDLGIEAEILDATPAHMRGIRGNEIKQWLDGHPEVTNYVIIDDDSDMLPEQLGNFVHTTSVNGFMLEHYSKALKILTGEGLEIDAYSVCRTDGELATCFEFDEHVAYFYQGLSGRGRIRGIAFSNGEVETYIVEDTSGLFPNKTHPFSHVVVDSTAIFSRKKDGTV